MINDAVLIWIQQQKLVRYIPTSLIIPTTNNSNNSNANQNNQNYIYFDNNNVLHIRSIYTIWNNIVF